MESRYCYIVCYGREVLPFSGDVNVKFVYLSPDGRVAEYEFDEKSFINFVKGIIDFPEKNGLDINTYFIDLIPGSDYESKIFRKIGRPSLGDTKKVSITLPSEFWDKIDSLDVKRSELFRELVYNYLDGYLDVLAYKQKE